MYQSQLLGEKLPFTLTDDAIGPAKINTVKAAAPTVQRNPLLKIITGKLH